MAYLTIRIKGTDGYTITPIEQERIVLGRSSTNDIQLSAEAVSRQHCTIYRFEGQWYVEDKGSSNGTRIKGEKITKPVELTERTVIKCGHARLTFHIGDPPAKQVGGTQPFERTPKYQMQPGDPAEAFPCTNCGTWLSASHRLPGEQMDCPRCKEEVQVPDIRPPELSVVTKEGHDDGFDEEETTY